MLLGRIPENARDDLPMGGVRGIGAKGLLGGNDIAVAHDPRRELPVRRHGGCLGVHIDDEPVTLTEPRILSPEAPDCLLDIPATGVASAGPVDPPCFVEPDIPPQRIDVEDFVATEE